MSRIKRLVLTFDAFGTLFTPREPIAKSYADIARKHGLSGFTDVQIASRFRDAFRQESRSAPNYGKKAGLAAPQWWSNVIQSTFRPYTSSISLPEQLVPDLLNRFSSSEGYTLYADVSPIFQLLREIKEAARKERSTMEVAVGVITNSDDRVPQILSSLGIKVGALRYGMTPSRNDKDSKRKGLVDIDFVALSYDVGFQKPSREIFDAAKSLGNPGRLPKNRIRLVHVGDDLGKDSNAAEQAGWEALLLDREGAYSAWKPKTTISIPSLDGLKAYVLSILVQRSTDEWKMRRD